MDSCGFPWISLDPHQGIQGNLKEIIGSPLGFPWASYGFPWISLDPHEIIGSSLGFLNFLDFPWILWISEIHWKNQKRIAQEVCLFPPLWKS